MRLALLSMIIPLVAAGQELQVLLPDTTLNARSPSEAETALAGYLSAQARHGILGGTLRINKVSLEGAYNELLKYEYLSDIVPLAAPDTLLAYDAAGRSHAQLMPFLERSDPPLNGWLYSHGEPVYQITGKRYFALPGMTTAGYGVLYQLRDRSISSTQLSLAYDQAARGGGRVVGRIDLDLPNIMGTLRRLELHYLHLKSSEQTVELKYAEPKLPELQLGGSVGFKQEVRDSLYLARQWSLEFTSLPGGPWQLALGVGGKSLWPGTGGEVLGLQAYRQQSISLAVARRKYDSPLNPAAGGGLEFHLAGGVLTGEDLEPGALLARGDLLLEAVLGLRPGSPKAWVWAQSLETSWLMAYRYQPQWSDYDRFGGSRSLRGYREEQFAAGRGAVLRSEIRRLTGEASRLYLFIDGGLLDGYAPQLGYGAGMLLKIGPNLLKIDLAWTGDDTAGGGKLHVSLLNWM